MTTEEKAKAYDEALRRAEAAIDIAADKDLVKGVAITIFPELKESEDERIRKAPIDGVRQIRCKNEITREQMLAWLEKQKGASKAIEAVEKISKYITTQWFIIDEHLANAHDMKDSNPEKKYYRGWDDAVGKIVGILQDVYSVEKKKKDNKFAPRVLPCSAAWFEDGEEKQQEQKPYEPKNWPADKNNLTQEQKPAENPKKGCPTYPLSVVGDLLAKMPPAPIRFEPEQKPEWSPTKEQMVALNWAANGMLDNDSPSTGDIKASLRSLYNDLQSKSIKPAEWSEEDEAMRDNILRVLSCFFGTSECDSNPSLSTSYPAYQKEIAWLKSLRPSWKPSEEQMKALSETIAFAPDTFKPKCTLITLQNDLKKL